MASYTVLSHVVPFVRAGGTPTVHQPASRWLHPLCTNLHGLPPFVREHEKYLQQCCCQGLRWLQLQVLAAYLLHLSWCLKCCLLVLLLIFSHSVSCCIRLEQCVWEHGGAEQILSLWTRLFKNVCVYVCPSDALLLSWQAVGSSTSSCFLFLGEWRWASM